MPGRARAQIEMKIAHRGAKAQSRERIKPTANSKTIFHTNEHAFTALQALNWDENLF
jgi:hypothetical protein